MTSFHPMPDLISQQEDNFQQTTDVEMNDKRLCDEMLVETKTNSKIHFVNWAIDNRSLHIAKLAPKGDKRGVIEANVSKDNHRFKLELCASGWRNSQDGYCAFYLTVADQNDLFVARYRVQVGDITRISSIRHDFHLGVGFPNFCQQETLENLMENNSVRFLVTVEVFSCASTVKPPKRPLSISYKQKPESILLKLVKTMYNERLHSDVHLVCQDLRIPAHKCILAHASPVFRAMFAHNLLENTSNEVRMYDWDAETVLAMVEFLYTAKISDFITSNNNNDFKRSLDMSRSNMELDEDLCSLSFGIASTISPSPTPTTSTPIPINNLSNEDISDILSTQIDNTTSENNEHKSTMDEDIIPNNTGLDEDGLDGLDGLDNEYNEQKYNSSNDIMRLCNGSNNNNIRSEISQISNKIDLNNNNSSSNSSNNIGDSLKNALSRHKTFKLFQLGEYYKIESLVIACCEKMHSELTVETACHLLIRIQRYAHGDEIQAIKSSIWDFVTQNLEEIKKSNGYETIVRSHPDLLRQLVDKMTKKFINSKEFEC